MPFVSYAQNYEDVLLRRALKDIENGFYIDVGAYEPSTDSVTKAFYDAGWCGINIEPVSEHYERLSQERPHDINLQIAVGAHQGETDFYEVVGTGLSTTDEELAEKHARELGYKIKRFKVPVTTLSDICIQYARPDIHFLKMDIEGSEKSAILGMNLDTFRPWILVIESTLPNSPIQDYEDWEHILLAADYEFVYFDGLSRFYVAKEHHELAKSLAIPPNVFDDFIRFPSLCLQNQLTETQASLTEAQASLTEAQAQKELLGVVIRKSEQLLEAVEAYPKAELDRKEEQLRNREAELQIANAALSEKTRQISKLERDVETATNELGSQIGTLKRQVESLETDLSRREMSRTRLSKQLQDVYASKSWKLTLPLRKLVDLMIWVQGLPKRLRIRAPQSRKNRMTANAPEGAIQSRQPNQLYRDLGYGNTEKSENPTSVSQDLHDVDEMFVSDAIARVASLIHKEAQS